MRREGIIEPLIRSMVLFGFGIYFLKLLLSGDISNYIAPQMIKFAWLASIFFILLSIILVLRTFEQGAEKHSCEDHSCECSHIPKKNWKKGMLYSLFLIPLLLGFALPEKPLDVSMVVKKGINLNGVTQTLTQKNIKQNPQAESISSAEPYTNELGPESRNEEITNFSDQLVEENSPKPTENQSNPSDPAPAEENDITTYDIFNQDEDYYDKLAKLLSSQETVLLEDKYFLDGLTTMDWHPELFEGKKIKIFGFVYREPDMPLNQYVVARYAMMCCSADAQVYGILVDDENGSTLKDGSWVEVTGTLTKSTYHEMELMMIHQVSQVTEKEAPEDPYIYPGYLYEEP